ncbi:MAG: M12 family metallo-peptidase, partial [Ignavibacteria bacterium]
SENFKCGVEGREETFIKAINSAQKYAVENSNTDNSALPVKIYFEADYQMYLDGQNNTQNVSNFITGMFNSVKTIYQNENIPVEISSIGVWTATDPYRNITDSYEILKSFGRLNQNDFQGNLAHLLSTRNEGLGGIAWIRVLCADYNPNDFSGRYAFSNIDPGYNNFPTYSWTVNVVAHEMGHSFGSMHTHACVWPAGPSGAIRAIDSCFTAEGGCFPVPRPRIGTIMSYCHLWTAAQGGGVNLSAGFGQLPGDTIRLRYSQAGCLTRLLNSSEAPASFSLAQNFPNPFNPSTIIRFALPKESIVTLKVYDVNGRLVATLIENESYNTGFYDKAFSSGEYKLSSGIFFYKLDTGDFTEVKRMVLIK